MYAMKCKQLRRTNPGGNVLGKQRGAALLACTYSSGPPAPAKQHSSMGQQTQSTHYVRSSWNSLYKQQNTHVTAYAGQPHKHDHHAFAGAAEVADQQHCKHADH
ncbi:MAG: hypothetical protein FRX49_12987 [Trebouxia sp. A1-2]|nr:MAG: hypothetical protein FRX49_12987 [Trebouxia sp. A1-2]